MPSDVFNVKADLAATPVTAAQTPVGGAISPLRSAETFDTYCNQVQERLAAHAVQRLSFLQAAYDRLAQLLQAARDMEDVALYNELAQHRIAARELLEAVRRAPQSLQASTVAAEPNGAVRRSDAVHARTAPVTPQPSVAAPGQTNPPVSTPAYAPAGEATPPPQPVAPRLPRRPMRLLGDIEADAARLRGELREWQASHSLNRSPHELNIPNCLRLRAIACRHRRLEEEAGDTEVAEVTELSEDLIDLLDSANDQEYTVALDDELDPRPTVYQWSELAERYEEMARAQEAFEWWQENRGILTVAEVQPLAEAVAAVQQRFNRLLFRIGARDPFQQQLFDDLRTWAREDQCYLFSLRPKVPMAELVEKAATLEPAWEKARLPVAEEKHRQDLIEDLVALVSQPGFGENPEADEERLREALWECRSQRIPASDRRLRDALLPWAAFLESDERFKDVLREINLEWERRQEAGRPEETEEEEENALDTVAVELAAVREVTRGKRCLLLGGTCREENRRKLEEALQLEELVWPSTKPSDPLAKFDTEIRHSDIVALLTRFSRKEWKNAQDICARDGKKFVHLTTGYGVSQVVRHFYNQISPEGAVRA